MNGVQLCDSSSFCRQNLGRLRKQIGPASFVLAINPSCNVPSLVVQLVDLH